MTDILIGKTPNSGRWQGALNSATYVEEYEVELDSWDKGGDWAEIVSGIPDYYTPQENSGALVVRSKSATRKGNTKRWVVEVEYSTDPEQGAAGGEQSGNSGEEIESFRPTMSIDHEEREEAILNMYDDDREPTGPIKNSAGWVFSPPPVRTRSRSTVTIERNFVSFSSLSQLAAYQDCINSDTFFGCPAHTFKLASFKPITKKIKTIEYLAVRMVFKFRPETWDLKLLDYGPRYISDGTDGNTVGKKYARLTEDGLADFTFLDGSTGMYTDTPTFLAAKQIYTAVAFSGLGLSQTISDYVFV